MLSIVARRLQSRARADNTPITTMHITTWPISLSTGCFYRRSIFDVLHQVRDSDFHNIEICSSPTHLDYHSKEDVQRAGSLIHELGMRPLSFHAPFAEHIDITSPEASIREASVQELILACEAAAHMRCTEMVLHPGPEREGRPQEEEFLQHMHHAAESLNRVADCCCQLGIHLLLENMLAHLLFGHVRDMMYLLGEIKTCDVGVCLDTGHAHLAGELGMVIQKLTGHLQMVHVNDNRGDWDAHLPPGEGTIDWRWVLGELHRCGFGGVLVLELSAGAHEDPATVLSRAVKAREYLEKLCRDLRA